MRPAVVVADAFRGSLTRYELGEGRVIKTHRYEATEDYFHPITLAKGGIALVVTFGCEAVEHFRRFASGEYYIGPLAPIPGTDDPGPNGAAPAMAAAA